MLASGVLGACSSRAAVPAPTPEARAPAPAGAEAPFSSNEAVRASTDEWYLRSPGDDCRLYVRQFGVGDTVVVVHGGFGAEHSYMLDAFVGLEDRYHFVFYDQRGSLRSPCPDSTISVDAHVADLERLRTQLGLETMNVVAHSMGTFIAMRHLERHGEHVGRVVLLGPIIPRMPADDEEGALYQEEQRQFVEWAQAQEQRELAEEGLAGASDSLDDRRDTYRWRVAYASGNIFHIERWRLLKGGQVFYDQAAGTASGRTMGEWDFTDVLASHPHPVTVIMGDHDLVGFGARLHRRMLEPLDGVAFHVLRDAGHNSWIDRPAEFRRLLDTALTSNTVP